MTESAKLKTQLYSAKGEESKSLEISNATLKPYDLYTSFYLAIAAYGEEDHKTARDKAIADFDLLQLMDEDSPFWETEDAAILVNETLWDILTAICPESHFFGAHEGDGACFGFWPFDDEEDDESLSYQDECRADFNPRDFLPTSAFK